MVYRASPRRCAPARAASRSTTSETKQAAYQRTGRSFDAHLVYAAGQRWERRKPNPPNAPIFRAQAKTRDRQSFMTGASLAYASGYKQCAGFQDVLVKMDWRPRLLHAVAIATQYVSSLSRVNICHRCRDSMRVMAGRLGGGEALQFFAGGWGHE